MNEEHEDNFLARWSRRKRAARGGEVGRDAPGAQSDAVAPASPQGAIGATNRNQTIAGPGDAEALTTAPETGSVAQDDSEGATGEPQGSGRDFSDIDFDGLNYDSNYTSFMDKDVPHDIRNKALRKLWVSNPVLANMDGLDDYCEDYTDAAVCLPPGVMKTAYKFGRGFLDDKEVAEWEELGAPEAPSDTDGEADIVADSDAAPDEGASGLDAPAEDGLKVGHNESDDEAAVTASTPGAATAVSSKA